jgi:phage terminase large subunit-like protein
MTKRLRQLGRPETPASNLFPTQRRPEQKIDGAVALMMAVGQAMTTRQARVHALLASPVVV